jgi:hypothetical protein
MMLPESTWGNSFPLVPFAGAQLSEYTFTALFDNTAV